MIIGYSDPWGNLNTLNPKPTGIELESHGKTHPASKGSGFRARIKNQRPKLQAEALNKP